jgi:hypothetical protein
MSDAKAQAASYNPSPSDSTTLQAESVTTTQQSIPLAKFTKFPELDKGLRLMIWQLACHQTRLIQLESDKYTTVQPILYTGTHLSSKAHLRTPVLFYVSREAHDEAKMVYKLVRFNSQIQHGGEALTILPSNSLVPQHGLEGVMARKYMWFNPISDIIYFGSESCFETILSIVRSSLPIHRVGIVVQDHLTTSCEATLPYCLQERLKTGHNQGLIHRLRILHGMALKEGMERLFPGCPALNEVFLFMTEEGPFDHILTENVRFNGRIEECDGFEKYTAARPHFPTVGGSRLTMDAYKSHLLSTILAPLPASDIAWKGRKTPTFQLARRSQPLQSGNIFKILALHFPNAGAHRMIWWKVNMNYRSVEEFSSTYFPNKYCGPGVYFFKFLGTVEKVTKLMKIALEEIPNAEALYKQKITMVDPDKAVFPAKIGMAHP